MNALVKIVPTTIKNVRGKDGDSCCMYVIIPTTPRKKSGETRTILPSADCHEGRSFFPQFPKALRKNDLVYVFFGGFHVEGGKVRDAFFPYIVKEAKCLTSGPYKGDFRYKARCLSHVCTDETLYGVYRMTVGEHVWAPADDGVYVRPLFYDASE